MATTENGRRQLLTVQEVADLLQVKTSWVYSHVAKGDIPHMKVGHYVRFSARDVLDWARGGSRVA